MTEPTKLLDLKNIPCPLNVVKCKLALEKQSVNDPLYVELDRGEPEEMVKKSLGSMGYKIEIVYEHQNWLRIAIVNDGS